MPDIRPDMLGPTSFRAVRALTVCAQLRYKDVSLLLSRITSGRLHDAIIVRLWSTLFQLRGLSFSLPLRARHPYLLRWQMEVGFDNLVLTPLSSCSLWEKLALKIYGGGGVVILDSHLETMATIWPELQVPRLTRNSRFPFRAISTLTGVRSFSARSANMVQIVIDMNETLPVFPSSDVHSTSLRELRLRYSPCESIEERLRHGRDPFSSRYLDVAATASLRFTHQPPHDQAAGRRQFRNQDSSLQSTPDSERHLPTIRTRPRTSANKGLPLPRPTCDLSSDFDPVFECNAFCLHQCVR